MIQTGEAESPLVGIIGLGEVGKALTADLLRAGRNLQALDGRVTGARSARVAASLAIELDTSESRFAQHVTDVFVAVQGRNALEVAAQVVPLLRPGSTYADLTARSIEARNAIARSCAQHGVLYADLALMGTVAFVEATIDLLATGPGSRRVAHLLGGTRWHARDLGQTPIATEIKLCRSVFTKGLIALLVESLLTAEGYGVGDEVSESIDDLMATPFPRLSEHLVTSTLIHTKRRAEEAIESERLATSVLGRAPMSRATADVLIALERVAPSVNPSHGLSELRSELLATGLLKPK